VYVCPQSRNSRASWPKNSWLTSSGRHSVSCVTEQGARDTLPTQSALRVFFSRILKVLGEKFASLCENSQTKTVINKSLNVITADSLAVFGYRAKRSMLVVFSERELMFMFAICRRASVCLSSVCLSSVRNVHAPYSADWNFRHCFCAM